ncbi:MAG: endonuclease/exonuclease/phosphatase family protein [Nitrospiraceae bacterium]|nr:endonuclease/exonuclease/phosphatase family protein [Nitrospiraceae bacterium]
MAGIKIRFGQFNIRDLTMEKLLDPANPQALAAARIIKRFLPDVLSIDEMQAHPDAPLAFVENFLKKGEDPVDYPFFYIGQTNSGVPTGFSHPYDYKGYGRFRGQYGIACLSRPRIDFDGIRNLKDVSWGALPEGYCARVSCPRDYPLWSTSFLDLPIEAGYGTVVHSILVHPTVPLREYVNLRRNADQVRFLKSYIDGLAGTSPAGGPFVVIGDLNVDPDTGIGTNDITRGLLEDGNIIYRKTRRETFLEGGGVQDPPGDGPGLLKARLDYILPSSRHFSMGGPEVFAPEGTPWWPVARRASDHFFVYADCELI